MTTPQIPEEMTAVVLDSYTGVDSLSAEKRPEHPTINNMKGFFRSLEEEIKTNVSGEPSVICEVCSRRAVC